MKHDVGTGGDDPTERWGRSSTRRRCWGRTARPVFAPWTAKTLREVLTTENKDDRHGKTSQLSATQIDDLVEFLKALPYEDPTPAAKSAGLVKVAR